MLTFQEKREFLLAGLIRSERLGTSEKMVAIALAFRVDSDGSSNITTREIMALASLSRQGVQNCIHGLEDKIDLIVSRTPAKNTYQFRQWSGL